MLEIAFFPSAQVMLSIGWFSIYWYGLIYVVALTLAIPAALRLQRYRNLNETAGTWLEIVTWTALGILVGGRLGYVIIYDLPYFIEHPAQIAWLQTGGMSFFGALFGGTASLVLVARLQHLSSLALLDIASVLAAAGVAVGRFGNLLNNELFLTPGTRLAAIVVPAAIALGLLWHIQQRRAAGLTAALFTIAFGLWRLIFDPLRADVAWLAIGLSRSQLLALCLIGAGVFLLLHARKRTAKK